MATEIDSDHDADSDLSAIAWEAPDFHFVDPWIPHLVRCAGDVMCIDAPAKVLLRELCEYVTAGGGDRCSVSLARLALRTGYSKSWVRIQIDKLEGSGLVSIIANRQGGAPGQTPVYCLDRTLLRQRATEGQRVLEQRLADGIRQKAAERTRRARRRLAAQLDAEAAAEHAARQRQASGMQSECSHAQYFTPQEFVLEQEVGDVCADGDAYVAEID